MQMTEKEIVKNYIESKNKTAQVGILADLNLTDKETIKEILKQNGISYPPKRGVKTKEEQEVYKKIMSEEPQKAVIKKTVKNENIEDPKAAAGNVPDIVLQMVNEKIYEMQEELEAIIAHEKELNGKLEELKEFVKRYE